MSLVQVASPSVTGDVRTVAICARSGGSMLVGRDADVYLTGEMSQDVSCSSFSLMCRHCTDISLIA